MKLTIEPGAIPPRPLNSQEAAAFLMGKRHIAFIGCAHIPDHQSLIADLAELLPGQVGIYVTLAEWRPSPGAPKYILTAATPGDTRPEYTVAFIPDDLQGRRATGLLVAKYGGRAGALYTLTAGCVDAPILMLYVPGLKTLPDEIQQGYLVTVHALQALAEGHAIDVTSN